MGYAAIALPLLIRETAEAPYRAGCPEAGPGPTDAPCDPDPDPTDAPCDPDPDLLDDLAEEIATLAAHIHAATHRLLVLIAEFDRLRGWELAGHRSCAHWLAVRTGIDLGAAREKVRAARALQALPLTSAAMSRGELSFSQVRALTRVAEPANEGDLLELAKGTTTAVLERIVRAWRKGSREDEAERERRRHAERCLSVFPDDDGMYVVRGRLTPEVGALLMRAVEAASDALYRERRVPARLRGQIRGQTTGQTNGQPTGQTDGLLRGQTPGQIGGQTAGQTPGQIGGQTAGQTAGQIPGQIRDQIPGQIRGQIGGQTTGQIGGQTTGQIPGQTTGQTAALTTPEEDEREAARRRADALGLLAERALAAGFGGAHCTCGAREASDTEGALDCDCDASPVPLSGTRAERYQVMLHVEPATLRESGEPGRSELADGTRVSAETSRRLCCDASVVRVEHASDGTILSVGRRTRTIPPAIRRALEARDRGCRFPGCGSRFADGHHVVHWADGGETSLANLCLLCHHHHLLVHERGWRIHWWGEGRVVFTDPRGGESFDGRWKPPALGRNPVKSLVMENTLRGASPDGWTAGARWERERDIPDDVYLRASGAR